MLARILSAVQRPGALKLTLAVAAVAWGTTAIMKTTNEAVETAQAADAHYAQRMAELEALDAAIGRAENRIGALRREAEAAQKAETPEPPAQTGENID